MDTVRIENMTRVGRWGTGWYIRTNHLHPSTGEEIIHEFVTDDFGRGLKKWDSVGGIWVWLIEEHGFRLPYHRSHAREKFLRWFRKYLAQQPER